MKEQLLEAYNKGTLLDEIINIYRSDRRVKLDLLINSLIELHDSQYFNINEEFLKSSFDKEDHDFFNLRYIYESCLPLIKDDHNKVLKCTIKYINTSGNNLVSGRIHNQFQDFCVSNEGIQKKIVQSIIDEVSEYENLLSVAIVAASYHDALWSLRVVEGLAQDNNPHVRWHAYNCIGEFYISSVNISDMAFNILKNGVKNESSNQAISNIPISLISIGLQNKSYWEEIHKLLDDLYKKNSPELLNSVSRSFAFKDHIVPSHIFHQAINLLSTVTFEYQETINNIDHLLYDLVKIRDYESIEGILKPLLLNEPSISINYFSSFTNELLNGHEKLLNKIVSSWFLSGEVNLGKAVSDLIHKSSREKIELSVDKYITRDSSIFKLFIARKAIGWLFTLPISSTSLLLSTLEEDYEEILSDIEELLFSPLLLSFTGEVRDYLEEQLLTSENEVIQQLVKRLISRLEDYFEGLDKMPDIRELRAPRENIDLHWKVFNKSMQQSFDETPRSPILELFTTQHLLYGSSSAYYVYDGDGTPRRSEMQMSTISHSSEFPRLDILDPYGLDYTLRVYRVEKIKNEANS